MNSGKDTYNDILNQIKALQPKIPDSQRLISKTMDSIEIVSKKKSGNKILTILSLSSSIAASLLIGLFLFEMFLLPENKELKSSQIPPVHVIPASEKNMDIENPMTLSEFRKTLNIKKKQHSLYTSLVNK